jgi:allantoin racemase
MLRIHVVNPNTTRSMTEKAAKAAQAAVGARAQIVASQPEMGPVSIEGYYDEAFSVPGMLAEIRKKEADGVAAHVIACFDDTGLEAARSIATGPVIGIGEAAYHAASLLAGSFSVITTLSRSIPALKANLTRYGLISRCAKVRAAEVPVLALEEEGSPALAKISAEIERAKAEDECEAIVLGCAGMADLAAKLSVQHNIPVIEGVSCAAAFACSLAELGLKTSKLGGYARPIAKPYLGSFAGFAPE